MSVRPARRSFWSHVARVGQAAWFFGNLYEGVVGVPELLADAHGSRTPGIATAGSPVRYFGPVALAALGPSGVIVIREWRAGADGRPAVTTAVGLSSALALSAYLVATVNVRLLAGHEPLRTSERDRLVTRWHRVNRLRLVALAVAIAGHPSGGRSCSGPPSPRDRDVPIPAGHRGRASSR